MKEILASCKVAHMNNYYSTTATGRKNSSNSPLPIPRVCVTFCHSPEKESYNFDNTDIKSGLN